MIQGFLGVVKNGYGLFLMRHWDLLYFKNKFMNWADFLNAADDAIIWLDWYPVDIAAVLLIVLLVLITPCLTGVKIKEICSAS